MEIRLVPARAAALCYLRLVCSKVMGAEAIFTRLVKSERLGRVALLILMLLAVDKQATAQSGSFEAWLAQLRQEAAAEGISAATLDQALDGSSRSLR